MKMYLGGLGVSAAVAALYPAAIAAAQQAYTAFNAANGSEVSGPNSRALRRNKALLTAFNSVAGTGQYGVWMNQTGGRARADKVIGPGTHQSYDLANPPATSSGGISNVVSEYTSTIKAVMKGLTSGNFVQTRNALEVVGSSVGGGVSLAIANPLLSVGAKKMAAPAIAANKTILPIAAVAVGTYFGVSELLAAGAGTAAVAGAGTAAVAGTGTAAVAGTGLTTGAVAGGVLAAGESQIGRLATNAIQTDLTNALSPAKQLTTAPAVVPPDSSKSIPPAVILAMMGLAFTLLR